MARSSDLEEREIWGTWEELLLACAVNRHGTRRWDSVAIEIQSRTPASHLITPHGCRQRYRDLQRRFSAGAVNGSGDDDGGDDDGGDDDDPHPPADVPWLEELRRLRVAELRREVQRYDLSIGSLQLKVKRLQDERERSARDAESGDGKPVVDAKKGSGAPGSTPESLSGNRISSGGDSGPSCEQSNSTDPKQKAGEDCREPEEEAAFAGAGSDAAEPSTGGDEKAAEGSYDSSTGSPAARTQAMGESIAESKEVEEGEKESSDVQSSVSLSRRRGTAIIGGGGVEEPEAEEASIMSGVVAAASQPLVSLLEIIRSRKYGSVFERRLESQESLRYRSIVRQHVDLEMVRAKLDPVEAWRSYATSEFFRDLLLLCGNATVFYPKDSPEFAAAVHLRRLVTKEMATTVLTPTEPTPQPPPPPPEPKPTASKSETEPDLSSGLVDKPNSSPLLIACRKRSSTSNKPAVAAVEKEEKSDPARIESDNEEKSLPKKTTKERSVRSGRTRGWRTSKVRGGYGEGSPAAKRSNVAPSPCLKSKPVENVAAVGEAARPDKKNTGGGAATCAASTAKKQGSTGFLKRMKRNPKGAVEEMPKSSSGGVSGGGGGGGSGRGTEQKKEAKGGARKEQGSRQGSTGGGGSGGSGKKVAETSGGSAKRGVGRPPKRAREEADIAAPSKAPASASRKRRRM